MLLSVSLNLRGFTYFLFSIQVLAKAIKTLSLSRSNTYAASPQAHVHYYIHDLQNAMELLCVSCILLLTLLVFYCCVSKCLSDALVISYVLRFSD